MSSGVGAGIQHVQVKVKSPRLGQGLGFSEEGAQRTSSRTAGVLAWTQRDLSSVLSPSEPQFSQELNGDHNTTFTNCGNYVEMCLINGNSLHRVKRSQLSSEPMQSEPSRILFPAH